MWKRCCPRPAKEPCNLPQSPSRIRLLCVDDHRIVLDGLVLLIGREPDMEVVATAPTGELAVARFGEHRPDVTLMDLQLPGMSGLQAIRAIRAEAPDARIVVLTMFQGDEDIYRAYEAGVMGYLLKDTLADDLTRVTREIHAGQQSVPDTIAARLASRQSMSQLTAREIQVVQLIAKGMRNKEIAVALGITEHTAKVHVRHIIHKFRVHDRAAIIALAIKRGLLHLD